MEKKYLLIAISAFFLLTCATSCNNGKSANDKNDTEEVTEKNMENGGKDDAEKEDALVQNPEDDALIRDFITNMYENEL